MSIEKCELSCEGCPMSEVFFDVDKASKSDSPIIKSLGEASIGVLNLREQKGPQDASGQDSTLILCCKQPEVGLIKDTLRRFKHAIEKINSSKGL